MTSPAFDAIVFDLDGTLIDSAPDIAAAVNKTLASRRLPELPASRVAFFIGSGSRDLMARVFDELGKRATRTELESALADYMGHYRASPAARTRPYPGVREALETLRERGTRLGVCTNKREDLARAVLDELGLLAYFASVVGCDRLPWCKPDPRHLQAVVEELGASPSRVAYVGDMEIDRQCAEAAGIEVLIMDEHNRAEILRALPGMAAKAK